MTGKSSRPESEALDLARLTPQQIAAELARRSQGLRATTDTPAERAESPAAASSRNEAKAEGEASPFARLTRALTPHGATSSTVEARAAEDRLAEERAAERRRLKEQYVLERYRHEEEHDIREAARRAAEDAARGRVNFQAGGSDLSPDDPLKGEKRIADYAHQAHSASAASLSVAATVADESIRPNAVQTTPIDRLSASRSSVPDFDATAAAATGWDSARRDQGTDAHRTEASQEAASLGARRSESRWGELRAPDLRAPEDIRNLVTTSFDRPIKPVAGRHRHGVLILATALVAGLALYFHPWSGPEEGRMHSDLPSDRAAPVQAKPGGTAAISPAPSAAPASAAKPAADLPKPGLPAPQAAPQQVGPRQAASSPQPAVEMSPLSALPSASSSAASQPAAAAKSAANPQPPASQPPVSQPPASPLESLAPQALPVAPSEAALPAQAAKQTLGEATRMTTAPGAARPPEIKRAAKPVESDPGQAAAVQKAKEAYIKPSPAWLRVQPYDPGATAAPEPVESTPDAWMKPRPYNPGVLTPPGN
ncbi:MAG TPA: hypothetical protein VND94_14705 [Terriglobia bacterium]|nr:hypothetical protein [Terriglobia bacterium]